MNSKEMFIAYTGLVKKEWIRFLRIWPQSLLPPAITTTLYFLIFGHVIGSRVGSMGGVNYIDFIMPGLVMMSVIMNSYSNVVSSFYGSRYNKSVDEMLVSPMPNWMIVLGFVTGGVGRGFLIGLIVSIVGLFFTHLTIAHISLSLLTVVLCGTLFSLAGFINGIFARKFDDTSIIVTFVLTPLIYLGGVFYSIHALAHGWQVVSHFNPIYYIIALFRYSILGFSAIAVWKSFLAVIVFIVLLFSFCVFCMRRGIGIKT